MKIILPMCFIAFLLSFPLSATEIVHKFKNPSFSGVGTASHYLTVENQEFSRKKAIEEALETARKELPRGKRTIRP